MFLTLEIAELTLDNVSRFLSELNHTRILSLSLWDHSLIVNFISIFVIVDYSVTELRLVFEYCIRLNSNLSHCILVLSSEFSVGKFYCKPFFRTYEITYFWSSLNCLMLPKKYVCSAEG